MPCGISSLLLSYRAFWLIISYASRVSTDILKNIMPCGISSLLFTSIFICFACLPILFTSSRHSVAVHAFSFSPIILSHVSEIKKRRIFPFHHYPKVYLNKKAAASNLPAAAYLIIIALPDVPLRFISITLRCHPGYLPQKHPSSFRCATYLFHLFPWRQPSAVVPGRSLWCRSGSARVLQ